MTQYTLAHHKIIASALSNFNADFFCKNNIIFGGGTRIALELDEFRESIDIDFLCPNKASYKAVRSIVTNSSLGDLVKTEFQYLREIRADRDGVRTIINHQNTPIKLEFVSFDDYELSYEYQEDAFDVPFLDRQSCFYTKLLANSDRKLQAPFKDVFDILAMYKSWGPIPSESIRLAENHYGKTVVLSSLVQALEDMEKNKPKYYEACRAVNMKGSWPKDLIEIEAPKLLGEIRSF